MSEEQAAIVTLARVAMATRFEIVLHGDDPIALRAAGEEALSEIERLDRQLSLYRPTSEISHVNAEAADRPVKVSPPVYRLLEQCRELWRLSDGAFDITVAPLVKAWGFMRGDGTMPRREVLRSARGRVGMAFLELTPGKRTVRFKRRGMMLDLGAVGKGYAVDVAIEVLREAGVRRAFLHGGTSTSFGLGAPPGLAGWKVAVEEVAAADVNANKTPPRGSEFSPSGAPTIELRDLSLSISALAEKAFQVDGTTYGHVIDPRIGQPVQGAPVAGVAGVSATETDALSTALLIMGEPGFRELRNRRPDLGLLVLCRGSGGQRRLLTHGFQLRTASG